MWAEATGGAVSKKTHSSPWRGQEGFLKVVPCDGPSPGKWDKQTKTYISHFPGDGHFFSPSFFVWFLFLAIINKAAKNTHVFVFEFTNAFLTLG